MGSPKTLGWRTYGCDSAYGENPWSGHWPVVALLPDISDLTLKIQSTRAERVVELDYELNHSGSR
jgi:hypothetical protein